MSAHNDVLWIPYEHACPSVAIWILNNVRRRRRHIAVLARPIRVSYIIYERLFDRHIIVTRNVHIHVIIVILYHNFIAVRVCSVCVCCCVYTSTRARTCVCVCVCTTCGCKCGCNNLYYVITMRSSPYWLSTHPDPVLLRALNACRYNCCNKIYGVRYLNVRYIIIQSYKIIIRTRDVVK